MLFFDEAKQLLNGICPNCETRATLMIANPNMIGGSSPRGSNKGLRMWNCDDCDEDWNEHTIVDALHDSGYGQNTVDELFKE